MIRLRKPRKLAYVGYGKRRDKDGRELPPLYPSGLFFTTAAGSWYVGSLSELSDIAQTPEPQQLTLFEVMP